MKIIIEGAGEVGSHLAKMLGAASNDVVIIDPDEVKLQRLATYANIFTVEGNPASITTLKNAGIKDADLFIAVNPNTSQDTNIVSSLIAKNLGCPKVCARVDEEEYLSYDNKYMFTEMGIDLMIYPEKTAALEIVNQLKKTGAVETMDFARGKLQMSVFRIEEDSPLLEMKIAELSALVANDNSLFRIVAITRENTTLIPKFDTRFQYHDLVFIISKRDGIEPVLRYLGKDSISVNKVMILGGSRIGEMVANTLATQIDTVKIIEKNKELSQELRERTNDNVIVVYGDGRDSDLLLEENIKSYDAFVAVTGSDEANVLACVMAKKYGINKTIAEVENFEYIRIAEDMGVDTVINKKLITASKIYKMTLSNKVRFIKYMSDTKAEVLEYIVSPESLITKDELQNINFPHDAIIGGVIRGNDSFIAVGSTKIEAYDRVAVFALPEAVKEVDRFFK